MPTSRRTKQRHHFGRRHPLARLAGERCDELHGLAGAALIGGIACGECWERVIRDDERVVVEHGLSAEEPGCAFVDEVAIERACRGESVTLTSAERAVAVARLTARGLSPRAIAGTLRGSRGNGTLGRTATAGQGEADESAAIVACWAFGCEVAP